MLRFVKPKDQFFLMLPMVAMLIFGTFIAYLFLTHIHDKTIYALQSAQNSSDFIIDFNASMMHVFRFYYLSVVLLALGGFLWIWKLSLWIFGPFVRLMDDLKAIYEGRKDHNQIWVRKEDAIRPIVEMFKKIIIQLKEKNCGPK